MNRNTLKQKRLQRRKLRIKRKLNPKKDRMRLCISRSNKSLYAQIIDDAKGTTEVGISTLSKDFAGLKVKNNKDAAKELGKAVAAKALERGIKIVVFDRNGFLYHGKIKAFADSARESGLQF
ncbi:MAG: 50S ribosomal protein L18 [Spirochaetes bacterium]|nr:50S ribosomal protein L18 [Spirochaetota bacterium]